MKSLLFTLLIIPYIVSAQNIKPDTVKPEKNWITERGEFGANLGGGAHGFGFGMVVRYWYIGATLGVTKFSEVDKKPSDVKQYSVPHGDYTDYGFRSALFSITGDVLVPITNKVAVKLSAGANEQAIEYLSRSNATGWWYLSDKKDTSLGVNFIYGGGIQWNVWKQMVIGGGYVTDFGMYINIGGIL